MGNLGDHDSSDITTLPINQIYTTRTLYNTPIGVKYFCFEMNCYVWQCWLISTLLLELSRDILSYTLLIILSALQYIMLVP